MFDKLSQSNTTTTTMEEEEFVIPDQGSVDQGWRNISPININEPPPPPLPVNCRINVNQNPSCFYCLFTSTKTSLFIDSQWRARFS